MSTKLEIKQVHKLSSDTPEVLVARLFISKEDTPDIREENLLQITLYYSSFPFFFIE